VQDLVRRHALDLDHLALVVARDRNEGGAAAADHLAVHEPAQRAPLEGPGVLVRHHHRHSCQAPDCGAPGVRAEHVRVEHVDALAAQNAAQREPAV
jgi:hypothetical protein